MSVLISDSPISDVVDLYVCVLREGKREGEGEKERTTSRGPPLSQRL